MGGAHTQQGRRRVLKSGPAEDMVEYRRYERGRAREGVSPLSKRVFGGSPPRKF